MSAERESAIRDFAFRQGASWMYRDRGMAIPAEFATDRPGDAELEADWPVPARESGIRVVAFRRGQRVALEALNNTTGSHSTADDAEQRTQVPGALQSTLIGQRVASVVRFLNRHAGQPWLKAICRKNVADHEQLQGFEASVNAGGHSGSPDDASDVAGHPAMTATTASSPHRLSETPE